MRRSGSRDTIVPGALEVRAHGERWSAAGAVLLAAALLSLVVGGAAVSAARVPSGAPTPVEIVYSSQGALDRALKSHPASIVRVLAPLHVVEAQPLGDANAFVREMRHTPGVVAVRRPAPRAAADSTPRLGLVLSPAGEASEWQYDATGVDRVPPGVLAAARSSTIAVIDTGADLRSPDLAGKVVAAYNVRTEGHAASDDTGHGTFVASLAAGTGAGGVRGFGGAARLLVIKAAGSSGFTDLDVAAGIVYAVRHGARIINLSVAGRTRSIVEESAIKFAVARGALIVAAAGNDGMNGDPPEYPAALLQPVGSNGIGGIGLSVGASDAHGATASFSEYGSFVSLSAPGVSVLGALSSNAPTGAGTRGADLAGFATGTSFAAPEVAGAAALVWAADPKLTAKQVTAILKQTASGHGSWTPALGFGVIDVAAAVGQALQTAAQQS